MDQLRLHSSFQMALASSQALRVQNGMRQYVCAFAKVAVLTEQARPKNSIETLKVKCSAACSTRSRRGWPYQWMFPVLFSPPSVLKAMMVMGYVENRRNSTVSLKVMSSPAFWRIFFLLLLAPSQTWADQGNLHHSTWKQVAMLYLLELLRGPA